MKKTKLEMIVRERCKKCGGIIGENIDGKPICQCEVWPGNTIDWEQEHIDKLINTTNVKISHLEILPLDED